MQKTNCRIVLKKTRDTIAARPANRGKSEICPSKTGCPFKRTTATPSWNK